MTDDYTSSPNPHRLYKDKRRGVVAGVCAGFADYFGVDVVLVRIAMILMLIFLTPFALVGYIVAAIVTPQRPLGGRESYTEDEQRFWRGVSRQPEATFSNIKYRFRDLDERLRDIERVVTSDEWKLRRQFREIE